MTSTFGGDWRMVDKVTDFVTAERQIIWQTHIWI